MNDEDSLPNFICQSCWATTESFHELFQKSKSVQKKFDEEQIKNEGDLSEELPENPDYELHEPHFISTIKDEPDTGIFQMIYFPNHLRDSRFYMS